MEEEMTTTEETSAPEEAAEESAEEPVEESASEDAEESSDSEEGLIGLSGGAQGPNWQIIQGWH